MVRFLERDEFFFEVGQRDILVVGWGVIIIAQFVCLSGLSIQRASQRITEHRNRRYEVLLFRVTSLYNSCNDILE